ncbi:MAG TPA: peptidoglycan-binding domain-containing protein [Solirubrobacteraceae bacterium]|nr:peptidoglycan-binding domain-containing protein [Solirubrobacteraceae bacterium]
MSTITETVAPSAHGTRHERRDGGRRRREFTRAVALGAAISALLIGGAWAATSIGGSAHRTADTGAPTGAQTANQGSAAGGSESSAGGSHSSTGAGASYQHGASVVALQHELAQLNYYEGPVDGVLGPATLAAITNFQRANGLNPDGVAGAGTLSKIHEQLITGDSQMWPTAPPVKPKSSSSQGQGNTSTTGGTSPSGGTSTTPGQSAGSGQAAGGTTTPSTGGTSVAQ